MPVVNSYFKKFILVILALQILNLSIYNTDFYVFNCFSSTKAQVKDANPIDSFAEFVVEDIGGNYDIFPEPAHRNDTQSGEMKHNITFKMICLENFAKVPEKTMLHSADTHTEPSLFCNQYSYLFWKEINHPPA